MNKQKKVIFIIVSISIVILLILPLLLNELIFDNGYITQVSNDAWAGFFGSYIGGAIGGIGTLVAVYITVRQNQKQIIDAEEKEKKKRRIEEANEIATLVAAYLSDLQIYIAKEKECDDMFSKLGDRFYYKELLQQFKALRENDNFSGFYSYINILEEHNISVEYPKHFIDGYLGVLPCEDTLYNDYEKGLEEKIASFDEKVDAINQVKDDAMQRYVLGNNSYMLLDIKLSNMKAASNLKEALNHVQNIMTDVDCKYIWETVLNAKSNARLESMNKLKEETMTFVKMYVEGKDESQN